MFEFVLSQAKNINKQGTRTSGNIASYDSMRRPVRTLNKCRISPKRGPEFINCLDKYFNLKIKHRLTN